MKLYNWQKECLNAWISHNFRGIINVVTGAGKTQFALAAIDTLLEKQPELRIKIVVPTIPLAWQWNQSLSHHLTQESLHPGFFGGGKHDDPSSRVMIYIVNTARTALSAHILREFALNHPVLLICDECHHYQSRENRRIFDFLKAYQQDSGLYCSLGLSATPFGTGNDAILRHALGEEIYSLGFQEASSQGIVSPFCICGISVSFLADELSRYAELSDDVSIALARLYQCYPRLSGLDKQAFMSTVTKLARDANMDSSEPAAAFLLATYQRKEISVLAFSRLLCCLKLLEYFPQKERILIFCERISQAQALNSLINRKHGSISGLYHSEMTSQARNRVLTMFREKQLRIIVTCRCLDEGIDVPDASIGIVVSSSSVSRQRIQRLGRMIRRSDGKDSACLYYLYIRESCDDALYLSGLKDTPIFSLRYFTEEDCFANNLYEYIAGELLNELSRSQHGAALQEARACLLEGLPRPDYLLESSLQQKRIQEAASVHEKNYWLLMHKIGCRLQQRNIPVS